MSCKVNVLYFINDNNIHVEEIEKVIDISWNGDFLVVANDTSFVSFNKKNVVKFTFIEDGPTSNCVYFYKKNTISKNV